MEVLRKLLSSEQGYALVGVLLIMVIFSLVFVTFIGQSFSSAKQNEKVENNSQSVALAEMGISYYQAVVKNIYKTNQQKVTNDFKSFILTEPDRSTDYYSLKGSSFMKDEIIRGLNLLTSAKPMITIDDHPDASFKLLSYVVEAYPNRVTIELIVAGSETGTSPTKTTTLSTDMTISLNLVEVVVDSGSEPSGSKILPNFNLITIPTGTNVCTQNPPASNCPKILFTGETTYEGNNTFQGDLQQIIFATGPLTFKNQNKLKNVQLHTEGKFEAKNMQGITSSVIEVNGEVGQAAVKPGDATFNQLGLSSSTLFVARNLEVTGKADLINSQLYVGGNSTISNKLTINSSSRMCVKGNLTVNNKIDILGSLIINGKITGKISSGSPTYVNDQEFINKCGTSTAPTPPTKTLTLDWLSNITNTIDYDL